MTKVNIETLTGLFAALEGPAISNLSMCGTSAVITLSVPENLSWFDGHFPEHSVLPGVVQIDWAGKMGRALFVKERVFTQLSNIKFKSMVMPGTSMDLELVFNAEKGVLKFHFYNQHDSFSMGSFKFISL